MMKFYGINNPLCDKLQENKSYNFSLVSSFSMKISKFERESIQEEHKKDVPTCKIESISLKRASISVALQGDEPVVAIMGKYLLEISEKQNSESYIHQIFHKRKKFFKLQVLVRLWKPLSDPKFCKVREVRFNETYSDLREMMKHPRSFQQDRSIISISPDGIYLAYSRSLELSDKRRKHKKYFNKQLLLVDLITNQRVLKIRSDPSDHMSNDMLFWSQDSQLLGVYNDSMNSSEGKSYFIGVDPEKHSTIKNLLQLKEQVLCVDWIKNNEYRVCIYNAVESALALHTVTKTSVKLTSQVFATMNLGPNFNSNYHRLSPVALTYDTFDKCYFFWAHRQQRNGSSASTCDHIVCSLPESTFNIRCSDNTTEPSQSQWPLLGEPGILSPHVHTLRSRVPASTTFAHLFPVHRDTSVLAVELSKENEPQLRVFSGFRELFSPPSLRRLAARAVYAVPGALERWVSEGRVPKTVLLRQLRCNSFNFGPLEQI